MKYHIKLITGFRRDQEYTVPAAEAHKAYFLFNNPEARTTFSTGLAIKGSQIQEIVPNYQATMGWNESHNLDADDWNELNKEGIVRGLKDAMSLAQDVARVCAPEDLQMPLSQLVTQKFPKLQAPKDAPRGGGFRRIGE